MKSAVITHVKLGAFLATILGMIIGAVGTLVSVVMFNFMDAGKFAVVWVAATVAMVAMLPARKR